MSNAPLAYVDRKVVSTFSHYADITQWSAGVGLSLASAAYPTANKAFYYPIYLPHPFVARRAFVVNGTGTINGNWDVGIYTLGGTRIVSTGSIAQASTSVTQYGTLAETLLSPGAYYLAVASSSNTGTYYRAAMSVARARIWGSLQQTTAFALPATATFAAVATDTWYQNVGIRSDSSGF